MGRLLAKHSPDRNADTVVAELEKFDTGNAQMAAGGSALGDPRRSRTAAGCLHDFRGAQLRGQRSESSCRRFEIALRKAAEHKSDTLFPMHILESLFDMQLVSLGALRPRDELWLFMLCSKFKAIEQLSLNRVPSILVGEQCIFQVVHDAFQSGKECVRVDICNV